MSLDILRLAGVLSAFRGARERPGWTKARALEFVSDDLRALAAQALAEDREMIPVVVGLIYLLVDFRDGGIPEDAAEGALERLEERLSLGWLPPDWFQWLEPWVLHGDAIQARPGPAGYQEACTVLRWGAFCDLYAHSYGYPKHSPDYRERLSDRIKRGRIETLVQDLPLGANGVVWFTDKGRICSDCPSGDVEHPIDVSRAYDSLGLDWSRSWEERGATGGVSCHAILLSVSFEWRTRASRGLRAPIALDGWGCLGFVPGSVPRGGLWPDVGSFTVDPSTGRRSLPEGVHGRLDVPSGERCLAEDLGKVSKLIADRVNECGDNIIENALRRL